MATNYQFGLGGSLGQSLSGTDDNTATKSGLATNTPVMRSGGLATQGSLGGLAGVGVQPAATSTGTNQPPPKPGISGNQPPPSPTETPPLVEGVQNPTFSATNPLGENPYDNQGNYGDLNAYKWGDKVQIANADSFTIGPYHGYAYDAGARSLQSGYDAAGTLARAGTEASQLGLEAGSQLAAAGGDYGHRSALVGKGAWEATQAFENQLGQYGAQSAQIGADAASQMGTQGGQFIGQGAQAASQNIADVNLRASQAAMARSGAYADQLAGVGAQPGLSAAQAQLQSGLNQSQAANLAMARSGRGWGGSATAQTQALAANAAAGQQAVNQSAQLRAQEEQQRLAMLSSNLGQAAQVQQQGAQTALAQQQLAAQTNLQEAQVQAQKQQALYGLGLQAQQQGATLGLQGAGQAGQLAAQAAQTDMAGRQAYLAALQQGGQLDMAGIQGGATLGLQGIGQGAQAYAQGQQMAQAGELQAMQFASQQQQAEQALASNALQQYGIQKGVAIQQQANTNQLIGSGIQAAASLGGAAMLLSDKREKKDIQPTSVDLRPMSNYQIAGAAAGDAPMGAAMGGPNVSSGGGAAAAQTPKGGGNAGAAAGMAMGGVNKLADAFSNPAPLNPVLQQSLQGVAVPGIPPVVSDKRAKTDIQALDKAGSEAVQAINASGKSGQLAALDQATGDNIQAIRNAQGMSPTSAFDAAQAYSYQYKQPEKYGQGDFIGIMAQDLEKSPAGSTAVQTLPDGKKAVDMNRLGMLTAAAQSQTQEQVATLEEKIARLQRRVLSQQPNSDGTY
jgi:hypothetical protein